MRSSLPAPLVAPILILVLGCGDATTAGSSASGSSVPAASSARTTASTTPSATATPQPAGVKTTGEVAGRNDKEKVAFTLELPPGLKEFSDTDAVKQWRMGDKDFSGYNVTVMAARPNDVKMGLDGFLAAAEGAPDFKANQAKIVDKGKTDSGWYFITSFVEGGKKPGINSMTVITKGETSVMCRAGVEGDLASKVDEAVPMLKRICASLVITSP